MKITSINILFLLVIIFASSQKLFPNTTIDSLIRTSINQKPDTVQYQRFLEISKRYTNYDLDSAIIYSQKCIEIATLINDNKRLGDAAMQTGVYNLMKNNSEKGYQYLSTALDSYKAINHKRGMAKALNNIGIYYNEMGMLDKALESYLEAIKYWEGDDCLKNKANNINNIGIVYLDQTNYDKALNYFNKALDLFSKIDNTEGIAISYSNIGDAFNDKEEYDKALDYHIRSYQQELKTNSNYGIAHQLNKIGSIYSIQKKYSQALDTLRKALAIREKLNIETGICESSLNIGKVFIDLNNLEMAEKFCNRTYNLALEIKSDYWIKNSGKYLSIIYENKNDFRNALKYHKIYKDANDRIFSASKIKEITELAMNYEFQKETEKNQLIHETELLNQRHIRIFYILSLVIVLIFIGFILYRYTIKKRANLALVRNFALIDQQAKELKIANATKDKFFSIIAHDLRSPFNSLLGFSDILEQRYDEYNDAERIRIINILSKTSKNTFFLLDNLLTWSRSQLGHIDIKKELLNLKNLVVDSIAAYKSSASLKNITIVIDINHETTVFTDMATIKTVIGNLVNNAIKFTQPDGEIRITSKEKNKLVEICIHDNGIGMSKETLEKLFRIEESFTTQGTNKEKGTGLGLILCKEFVEKNGGEISVKSEVNKGSCFIFTILKAQK